MFAVFQMQQSPKLIVSFQNHMPSAAAISTIGASFGSASVAVQMHRTCSALA
jgi:hypothetical protein